MVNFDIYFLSIICERFNNIVKILYRGKLFLCWNLTYDNSLKYLHLYLPVFLIDNCSKKH